MPELHMICRPVVLVWLSVDEIVNHNPEITAEIVDRLFRQMRNLKQIDLIVIDEWSEPLRYLYGIV